MHAVRLPSYVAAATEGKAPLTRDMLREAETYAAGDYLVDLTRGLQDKAAVERVVGKVQTLTGLDADVVRRQAGRLDTGTVQREFARSRGRIVSAYDAGVSGYDPDPTAFRSDYEDPGLTAMTAPLTSAIVDPSLADPELEGAGPALQSPQRRRERQLALGPRARPGRNRFRRCARRSPSTATSRRSSCTASPTS